MHRHTSCIRALICPIASRSMLQQPTAIAVITTLGTPRQSISVLAKIVFAAMTAMLPIIRCCASPSFLLSLPAFHLPWAHVTCCCFCFPHMQHAESMGRFHKSCDNAIMGLAHGCMLSELTVYADSPDAFQCSQQLVSVCICHGVLRHQSNLAKATCETFGLYGISAGLLP